MAAVPPIPDALREAYRALLLPVSPQFEDQSINAMRNELTALDVEPSDQPAWLGLKAAQWADTGTADAGLRRVLRAGITEADANFGELLAGQYLYLHRRLKIGMRLSHALASVFLSHGFLMCRLARDEAMSSSQIARLLSARDRRVPISWQLVDVVVVRLGVKREVSEADVQQLFAVDRSLEEEAFADADLNAAIDLVAAQASALAFPGDLSVHLRALIPGGDVSEVHTPYLQILHYQCALAAFVDHALRSLYEFNPRGEAAEWLFGQYPEAMVDAANPFLNNAKSVDQVSIEWARSKRGGDAAAAEALFFILDGLETLGFAARKELCASLRRWLCRVMRLATPMVTTLPAAFTTAQISAIFQRVGQDETRTAGVIEQRLVDVIAKSRHPTGNWLSRGVGDSVNATNISSRKLGDCDFQNTGARRVVAYEAHGGRLTPVYIAGHLRTLHKILPLRQDEWRTHSDPTEWQVEIVFVAHELEGELPAPMEVGGTHVSFSFEAIEHACAATNVDAGFATAFTETVRAPLSARRTPDSVRAKLLELVA